MVKFWTDNWVNLHYCLCDVATLVIPHELLQLEVCHFVNFKGNWDWCKFQVYLLATILNYIAAIKPPNASTGQDVSYWMFSSSGHL